LLPGFKVCFLVSKFASKFNLCCYIQGADAPECRFGSLWPVAGRLASRGGAVACVAPAAARAPTPAPVAARGRPSAGLYELKSVHP
jgi:hypothetical protein